MFGSSSTTSTFGMRSLSAMASLVSLCSIPVRGAVSRDGTRRRARVPSMRGRAAWLASGRLAVPCQLVDGWPDPAGVRPDPEAPVLITITRASLAPAVTGPPANTASPGDSAPVVVLLPLCLTTVSLTSSHVQVVPSAARITTLPPAAEVIVPRSNASVWKPVLLRKVNSPATPPRACSRDSAHRNRGGGTVAAEPSTLDSAEFSTAARAAPTAVPAPAAGAAAGAAPAAGAALVPAAGAALPDTAQA